MTLGERLSRELDETVEQASATATALSAIGVEIRAVLTEERHDAGLSATVIAAQAKRAALAVTSLAGLAGQMEALARIGRL
jgi:hypothetical protein